MFRWGIEHYDFFHCVHANVFTNILYLPGWKPRKTFNASEKTSIYDIQRTSTIRPRFFSRAKRNEAFPIFPLVERTAMSIVTRVISQNTLRSSKRDSIGSRKCGSWMNINNSTLKYTKRAGYWGQEQHFPWGWVKVKSKGSRIPVSMLHPPLYRYTRQMPAAIPWLRGTDIKTRQGQTSP